MGKKDKSEPSKKQVKSGKKELKKEQARLKKAEKEIKKHNKAITKLQKDLKKEEKALLKLQEKKDSILVAFKLHDLSQENGIEQEKEENIAIPTSSETASNAPKRTASSTKSRSRKPAAAKNDE